MASNCGDCTPPQKEKFEKVNKLALEKFPKEYEQLIQKYSQNENQPKPDSKLE